MRRQLSLHRQRRLGRLVLRAGSTWRSACPAHASADDIRQFASAVQWLLLARGCRKAGRTATPLPGSAPPPPPPPPCPTPRLRLRRCIPWCCRHALNSLTPLQPPQAAAAMPLAAALLVLWLSQHVGAVFGELPGLAEAGGAVPPATAAAAAAAACRTGATPPSPSPPRCPALCGRRQLLRLGQRRMGFDILVCCGLALCSLVACLPAACYVPLGACVPLGWISIARALAFEELAPIVGTPSIERSPLAPLCRGDPGVRLPAGGVVRLCAAQATAPPGSLVFRWTDAQGPQGVCRLLGDTAGQCPGGGWGWGWLDSRAGWAACRRASTPVAAQRCPRLAPPLPAATFDSSTCEPLIDVADSNPSGTLWPTADAPADPGTYWLTSPVPGACEKGAQCLEAGWVGCARNGSLGRAAGGVAQHEGMLASTCTAGRPANQAPGPSCCHHLLPQA